MRPVRLELEHSRDLERIWSSFHKRFTGNVLGPHYERLCREWTLHMAPADLFGDHPNRVASGTVSDPANKTGHELGAVAFALADDDSSPLPALGEAKWNDAMGLGHLDRLRRIRTLLTEQGRLGAAEAKLACYSGVGFTDHSARSLRTTTTSSCSNSAGCMDVDEIDRGPRVSHCCGDRIPRRAM